MCDVNTVTGPVSCDRLGQTLTHEHIFVKNPDLEENYPSSEWDENALMTAARDGFAALAERGIATFVDLTVPGLGRSIGRIRTLAAQTPVNIVVATGFYTKAELPMYFHVHGPDGWSGAGEPLVEMFVSDIEQGIAGTDTKAGVLKVVTDKPGLTDDVRRVLLATAEAQIVTGVPIFTHSDATARTGLLQQQVLGEAGVDLTRLLIGHCDGTQELDYLRALMDAGSTIGFDRCGFDKPMTDAERVEHLVTLCGEGYADRIVLSHDWSWFTVNLQPSLRHGRWPEWDNTRVSDHILPALLGRGLGQQTVDQLMVENPRRLLSRHG